MLKTPHNITPQQAQAAVDCALVLGFGTEKAVFPVAGFNGDTEITTPDNLWQQTESSHHIQSAPQDAALFHSDYRTEKGLETIFVCGDFLQDCDSDYLPDRLNVKIRLPQNADSHTIIAACNIAFRLGMETVATSGSILADSDWNGNTIVFVPCDEAKMTMEKTDTTTVYIYGSGSDLVKFTSLVCSHFPKTDSFHTWGDVLCRMTEDFAMEGCDGQLAHLKMQLDTSADKTGWVLCASPADGATPAPPACLADAQIENHKEEVPVFSKSFDIPWEADTLTDILENSLYPHVKAGDNVVITAAVSESETVRKNLCRQICDRLSAMGAECDITLINSYKQGYSWLCEKVVPQLSPDTDKIEIAFRPFLPEGQTHWQDENGATPKRTVGLSDTPDRWLDLPIRYLQELYPAEDFIHSTLGIARDDITFVTYDGDEDITYLVTAFAEGNATHYRWKAHCSERPYLDRFPQLGKVHPSTAFVTAQINGQNVLDTTFKTDLENVWDCYQSQVLPACLEYTEGTQKGFDVTAQPFFSTLHLDITLSEEEKPTGSREDMISPLSALHEDLYFTGSDFFKYCGLEKCGRAADAPGLILPELHLAEGKPQFTATLTRQLADTPCITHHGRTVSVPTGRNNIRLWIKQLSLANDGLAVTIGTEGVCASLAQSYAALWNNGSLQISRTTGGFARLVFEAEGQQFCAKCNAIPQQKTRDITDIDLMEHSLIGYDDYIRITQQLKEVKGLQVFPVAQSYMGRTVYAVWLCSDSDGYLSMTKYLTRRKSILINTRHHANEVSGTNSAFMLIKKLLTEESYRNITDSVSIVFVPVENADGTAIHFELQKEHPTWQLHTARFNAVGREFAGDYFRHKPLSSEAAAMGRLYEKFVPDIVTDNHGVPSHEWDQQFSGYTSPAYKGFWLPRSLLYGYFWYVNNPEYACNLPVNREMERVIADAIAQDEQMTTLNREWTHQFEKYAHQWMPKLFPAEYYGDMINYWIGYEYNPSHMYSAIRYPWLTAVSYTSEVADETAQGEYLNLCARAHLAHDEATLQMMQRAKSLYDSRKTHTDNGTHLCHRRTRPMVIE